VSEKIEKKRLAILRALKDATGPLRSSAITECLLAEHHEIKDRTVRYYLNHMEQDGLIENLGRRGSRITTQGLEELGSARIIDRVGYLTAKIDQMTYQMNFDLASRSGTVVVNISIAEKADLQDAIPYIQKVFEAGYAMGDLVSVFSPGERIGETTVPEGKIGLGTVCSITLNGVLLAHGIPTHSSFGGLLEIRDHKPVRFVEFIHYNGTTLDPLEVFIRSSMTDYHGAIQTGNGRIGASFREFPAASREQVLALAKRLKRIGLGGFMATGWPGHSLLEIPVMPGQVGAIVIGGLNPAAILEERGTNAGSSALCGLLEYDRFFHYEELGRRVLAL